MFLLTTFNYFHSFECVSAKLNAPFFQCFGLEPIQIFFYLPGPFSYMQGFPLPDDLEETMSTRLRKPYTRSFRSNNSSPIIMISDIYNKIGSCAFAGNLILTHIIM